MKIDIATNTFTDKSDNFLITAPTYKIMQQATLPAFLQRMDGYGEYKAGDHIFKIKGGGTVYFRTETDPDSVIGITNVRAIWGDEAGKYRKYFWDNLQARAAFKSCQITLTTSIYARNWIYSDLYKPWESGKRSEVEIIRARSIENPHFPKAEYDRLKSTMDPRRFAMMYGGEFGQMEGLVYDCFDDAEGMNMVQPFELPLGTVFHAGVDWGYNPDPFAMGIRAITPNGFHYKISEFVKTGQTITDMIMRAKQANQTWGIKTFWCDPSQPGYIEEFKRNGLNAQPADNDINRGIGLHYELIKARQFKLFQGRCPYTIDELETYHYPEPQDLGPDDDSKEQLPVDQNNHCMDHDRYVTIMTYRSHAKKAPHTPGENGDQPEDQEKRLARLKKPKRSEW